MIELIEELVIKGGGYGLFHAVRQEIRRWRWC